MNLKFNKIYDNLRYLKYYTDKYNPYILIIKFFRVNSIYPFKYL